MKKSDIEDVGVALKLPPNPNPDVTLMDLVQTLYPKIKKARKNKWSWEQIAKYISDTGNKIAVSTLKDYMSRETARRRETGKSNTKLAAISSGNKAGNVRSVSKKVEVVPPEEKGPKPTWRPVHNNNDLGETG